MCSGSRTERQLSRPDGGCVFDPQRTAAGKAVDRSVPAAVLARASVRNGPLDERGAGLPRVKASKGSRGFGRPIQVSRRSSPDRRGGSANTVPAPDCEGCVMAVARNLWGHIERRDHRLMRRVHRWRAPRWVRIWMSAATRMGDGWIWCGLGLLLLAFGGAERFVAVGAAGLAALSGIFVFKILKRLSQRPRPCDIEPHCWSKI